MAREASDFPPYRQDDGPPRYRAILLAPSGQIASLINLIAGNDTDALHLAEAMVDGHAVELWDGVRFIEHFPAIHPTPPDD